MKLKGIFVAAVAVGALAAPAWAAPPFGSFGGKVGGGNSGAGLLPLHGWALDDDGIEAVDILVDGAVAGRAHYGRGRPGVTARFPGYPDSAAPGFALQIDTTHFLNGLHTVTAQIRSRSGEVLTLKGRTFEFLNNVHNLRPFGRIEFPNDDVQLFGNCSLGPPHYSVIEGYALDAGLQRDDTGVGYVELMIDRALWANTDLDCHHDPAKGGLSDCYGVRTDHVKRQFPGLDDALFSGFRFVLDVGALIDAGFYTRGHHELTIRVGDHADQVANIAEIDVTFGCNEDIPNHGSIGFGDFPILLNVYGGIVTFHGWALDLEGVRNVRIMIDGTDVGVATYGLLNPAVTSRYPSFPDSAAPGYRFEFDSRTISNGEHFFQVVVVDLLGVQTVVADRRFVVRNP